MLKRIVQKLFFDNKPLKKDELNLVKDILQKSKYSNPQLLGNNYNYTKFILLSTQRSGSTFVCSSLKSHFGIVSFGELFIDNTIEFNYPNFNKKQMFLLKIRNNWCMFFLKSIIYRGYRDNIQSVGFILHYNQYNNIMFKKQFNSYIISNKVKIIHLIRENYLDTYISFLLAKKQNYWYKYKTDTEHYIRKNIDVYNNKHYPELEKNGQFDKQLSIDYTDCLNYFEQQKQNIQYFRNIHKENQILEIYYNDVKNDYTNTMNRILDFLEVERQQLNSPLAKQNTKKKTEIIINYFELKKQFENTEYYHFFDE